MVADSGKQGRSHLPELKVKEAAAKFLYLGYKIRLLHLMANHLHQWYKFTCSLEPRVGGKMEAVTPTKKRK